MEKRMVRTSLLVALIVALGVGSLGAATCRWKGDSAGNGLWATPENWELDRKTRLLTAKTVEGAFSSVSLAGAAKDHYRLAWKGTSLDLRPQRGVAVIIR